MAVYLIVPVAVLVAIFLWLGDYGDCKPDSSFLSRKYRIWSISLSLALLFSLYRINHVNKVSNIISWESVLFLCFASFMWFIIASLISNYYIVFTIELIFTACAYLNIGQYVREINIPLFFTFFALIGVIICYILPQSSMRGILHILSKNQSNSVISRFLDGYKKVHCEFAVKFRWLRYKCAIRFGFYKIFEERFNAYYSNALYGRFWGDSIFLNEFDTWMHRELQNDNWMIVKKGLINPQDAVNTAIILSCFMIMKYSNDIFDVILVKDRRGYNDVASKRLFAMTLLDETIEIMKTNNTIDIVDSEKLLKEFDEIETMRIKQKKD